MAVVNLSDTPKEIITGNDSIVIVDNFQSIRGGRSLDVSDFNEDVIRAGHIIIKDTNSGDFKPMPITGSGGIEQLGTVTPGSGYTTDGTYTDVSLTGGTGSGAKATIVVSGGKVTSVTITSQGSGYKAEDSLSASAGDIGGGGSGFKVEVDSVGDIATKYDSKPANHDYAGILISSIPTKKAFAGIMVRGTVNPAAAPFSMDDILSAVKTALPLIDFRED